MKIHQNLFIYLPILFFSQNSKAQNNDSIQQLNEVVIESFQRKTLQFESTTSVNQINSDLLKLNHPERLLESFNFIPGTKMEERSPGSFRLSLRGSTIRSPFGVRNVKIYFDDFLLTDATGNAYLNLIEPQFIKNIDIMKGPQGGEYGSETGGIVLLQSNQNNNIKANVGTGSFGQFNESIQVGKRLGKHGLQIGQSHYQSNGYRDQSKIKRSSLFLKDQWKYSPSNEINLMLLYTAMDYETPGGLTLEQMNNNRKQSRLSTPTLPSAKDQKTGIINKTLLAGINHILNINEHWKQFTLIQTSYTDFQNPFISNFEKRKENNIQGRSYIDYKNQINDVTLNTRIGTEIGYNSTEFQNYDNNLGEKGNPQKFDNLQTLNGSFYASQHINFTNKWFVDASLSLYTTKYNWETIFPDFEEGKRKFKNQWLPQLGINYILTPTFSVRGKIAKGISSPTTEEVRSSNQKIQNNLNAEHGWNKEIGLRKKFNQWTIELSAFNYRLKEAIVKRQDDAGNDYFINAGGTMQNGIEWSIESKKFTFNHAIFNGLNFVLNGHVYDFKYKDYQVGSTNYSNHNIPGISKFSIQSYIGFDFLNNYKFNYTNYYNSSLYLNDANTVKEKDYIIGNMLVEYNYNLNGKKLNLYLGINNLYNSKYSSGYDLNAFGNRFYNPAATINYTIGSKFIL
ncbi:TonB-dependent receptor [Faecalibacter rhinopitheci]|uniref:TonB-dependent receptor n=1 Tax=Faecalibacter rhinopitheci TaxID=2779678 RepID=A0A8J7K4C6_9FLAO|nr:TonB-dependent receptor [Faecalibacter rhinopitheci]MBF0597308.1 TonB-dependent receptor [Faecalibacter rhinopitheci]